MKQSSQGGSSYGSRRRRAPPKGLQNAARVEIEGNPDPLHVMLALDLTRFKTEPC